MILMSYTIPIEKDMVCAKTTASVSAINAEKVCRVLNRKKYKTAKELIEDISNEKKSIDGKYYTKTSKEINKLVKILGSNASSRNIDPDQMQLLISAHQGPTLFRSRRKRNFGMKIKICHIHAVLRPVIKK